MENELRIGNIIQFNDESNDIVKVEEIYRTHPYPDYFVEWILIKGNENSTLEGNSTLEDFRPIPLMPELLTGCGFEVLNELDNWIIYKIPGLDEVADTGSFSKEEKWFKLNSVSRPVYYLHELQNTYFALTGNELVVNL